MKSDLISRQAAIDHLKKRLYETALNNIIEHPYYEEMADNRVSVWLGELPTIDPAENGGCWGCQCAMLGQAPVKHGKWRFNREVGFDVCSECGLYGVSDMNYCPNCGAKMVDDWEEPEINPCRGCGDYDGRGGCKSHGGCGAERCEE